MCSRTKEPIGHRVKHACGHYVIYLRLLPLAVEERYQDQGELLRAREHRLVWLEQHACPTCYYKDEAEERVDRLRQLGLRVKALPRLTGTDKQRWWARKIRCDKLDDIIARYARLCQQLDERVKSGATSPQGALRTRTWCDRSVAWVMGQAESEWWIENRTQAGWDLVRMAARTLRDSEW